MQLLHVHMTYCYDNQYIDVPYIKTALQAKEAFTRVQTTSTKIFDDD